MSSYLDFEKRLAILEEEVESAKLRDDKDAIKILEKDLTKEISQVFNNLTDYQKLQLARHPDRPYTSDYIKLIAKDIYEIGGDRNFSDDKAIMTVLCRIDEQPTLIIGEEKGRGTKNKIKHNFGMPNPEGYRKALRAARLAERFRIPILMLVDTPGAYPGIGAEERGQSEAIAKNLQDFAAIKVPTISIVIGEGGSGGALAISVADRLAMLQYSVFSVISPEGCAAILWNDPAKVEQATKAMKITPDELKKAGLIDDIINEPSCGAHRNKELAAKQIKEYYLRAVDEISHDDDYLARRYDKIMSYGSFSEKG